MKIWVKSSIPVKVQSKTQREMLKQLLKNFIISYMKPYDCIQFFKDYMECLINRINTVKYRYLKPFNDD